MFSFKRLGIIAVVALAISAIALSQPSFEVASIRPTDPALTFRVMQIPLNDGIVTIRGLTLKELIQYAWGNAPIGTGLHASLISGGPVWLSRDRYDIVAKADGSRIPSRDERKQMLRALLIKRFQLTFHREIKETAVYALSVAKNGIRMKERQPGDGGAPFSLPLTGLRLPGRNVSVAELVDILQVLIPLTDPDRDDRPVIDGTSLGGRLDFDLAWAGDPTLSGRTGTAGETKPDLFTAIQEQLGLRLELEKRAVEILVVDNAERPSEN